MNQNNYGSHLIVTTRLFFILLIIVGLVAPFTFLKNNVVEGSKNERRDNSLASKNFIDEKPLHNVRLPRFSDIKDIKEKKRKFFAFIKPAIEKHHAYILKQRASLLSINKHFSTSQVLSNTDKRFIAKLAKIYKLKTSYDIQSQLNALLNKVDIVPIPLTLVQAANESAWGTSRFSRVGLNFFGMWCFTKGCGMIPNGRDLNAKHEVETFKSVDEAIRKYTLNINTNDAYQMFRQIRLRLRYENLPLTSEVLAQGLINYSERGDEYVNELIEMIRFNQKYFSDSP